MALVNDRQFQMRVSDEFLEALDQWRRDQPGIPSRAEAVRRLVELAIGSDLPTFRNELRPIAEEAKRLLPTLDSMKDSENSGIRVETIRKTLERIIAWEGELF